MTTVAAIYDLENRQYVIGSDSLMTDTNTDLIISVGPKFVGNGKTRVGFSGSQAVIDVFLHSVWPLFNDDIVDRAGVFGLAAFFKNALRDAGFDLTSNRSNPRAAFSLLVASPGGLWEVDDDFSVVNVEPFWALGNGRMPALGAMHALYEKGSGCSDSAVVRGGLDAACRFIASCGGDIHVETVRW